MARSMVTDLQPTKARVVADLRASFGEVKCIGSERLVRLGISMTQLHVLNLLDRHGEMAMSRLADMLDVSMSAATGLIDRIEEHGYVERIRVPERPTDRPRPDHGRRTSVARRHRLGADRDPRSDPRRTRRDPVDPTRRGDGGSSDRRRRDRDRPRVGGIPHTPTAREELTTHGSVPGHAGGVRPVTRGGSGPWPEPPREDGDPLRGDAWPFPRRTGPDDRRSRAADHRHPAEWQRLLRLGHHDLPADQHDQRAVLGQAVRHLRPQAHLHDRHRDLPDRLRPIRPEPEHGDAHPLPRHPGHRRRFVVPCRTRGHR